MTIWKTLHGGKSRDIWVCSVGVLYQTRGDSMCYGLCLSTVCTAWWQPVASVCLPNLTPPGLADFAATSQNAETSPQFTLASCSNALRYIGHLNELEERGWGRIDTHSRHGHISDAIHEVGPFARSLLIMLASKLQPSQLRAQTKYHQVELWWRQGVNSSCRLRLLVFICSVQGASEYGMFTQTHPLNKLHASSTEYT